MIYFAIGLGGLIVGSVFTFFMTYPSYRRGYHDGKVSKIKKDVLDEIYRDAFDDAIKAVYDALSNVEAEEYEYDGN